MADESRATTIATTSEQGDVTDTSKDISITPSPEQDAVADVATETTTVVPFAQVIVESKVKASSSKASSLSGFESGSDNSGSESESEDTDKKENCKKEEGSQDKERVQRVDQVWSKKSRKYRYKPTPESDEKSGQASHVVLKVRRLIDHHGYPYETQIDIKSALLRDTLADIFAGIEGLRLNGSPPSSTSELMFHSRVGLAERVKTEEAKSTPGTALIDELGVALQYIAQDHAVTQASLKSLSEHEEITFKLLWAIFPPGIRQGPRWIVERKSWCRQDVDSRSYCGSHGATLVHALST